MSTIGLASRAAARQICLGHAAAVASPRASRFSRGIARSRSICPLRWTTQSLSGDETVRLNRSCRKLLPSDARCYRTDEKREQTHDGRVTTEQRRTGRTTRAAAEGAAPVHEDIYTIPNFLTLTRLVAAPAVGYLVLQDQHVWAVGLFAYAGVTDLLDGWIARRWNRKTVVGTIIDPLADKTLMTVLTVCLAAKGALPLWLATIILGRDVGLGISAIYYRWISLPPPKTFTRYWDFSLPSAEVRPTTISKYNTFLQLGLVGLTTAAPLVHADISPILSALQYIVAATTLSSGASYIFSRDAVKILKK